MSGTIMFAGPTVSLSNHVGGAPPPPPAYFMVLPGYPANYLMPGALGYPAMGTMGVSLTGPMPHLQVRTFGKSRTGRGSSSKDLSNAK